MNNYDWRQQQKKSWPDRSLEKTLLRDFPGSTSVLDALEKAKARKPNQTALQTPIVNGDYEQAKAIIEELKILCPNHIYEQTPIATRQQIAKIQTNTVDEFKFYSERLKLEISKLK